MIYFLKLRDNIKQFFNLYKTLSFKLQQIQIIFKLKFYYQKLLDLNISTNLNSIQTKSLFF